MVTGDRESHPHRLADYAAYYRSAKRRFEERVFATAPAAQPATYPEPVDHCRVCSWWALCVDRRRADDHLSLVAGAARDAAPQAGRGRRDDPRRPRRRCPGPRRPRHRAPDPRPAASPGVAPAREARGRLDPLRADPAQPGRARQGPRRAAAARRALDVFFDIEADPWALDDGLEYLFGWTERGRRRRAGFHADLGARPGAGEGDARGVRGPGAGALAARPRDARLPLRRLRVGRAQAADAAARDARGRDRRPAARPVLVNLYDHVVRQGIRASVESYSIKKLETFYMPEREGGITQAGFSRRRVRALDGDRRSRDPRRHRRLQPRRLHLQPAAARLARGAGAIEAARTHPSGTRTGRSPGPPGRTARRATKVATRRPRRARARMRCATACPKTGSSALPTQQGRWLLAALLDWHRREAKPQWWDHFRLVEAPMDDLVADGSALAELAFDEDLGPDRQVARSTATGSIRRRTRRSSRASRTSRWRPSADGSGWDTSTVEGHRARPARGHDRPQAQRRRARTPSR